MRNYYVKCQECKDMGEPLFDLRELPVSKLENRRNHLGLGGRLPCRIPNKRNNKSKRINKGMNGVEIWMDIYLIRRG